MNSIKNSYGITLIETVAAILLIGFIFIAFSGLLLSSKKMFVASEDIVDATYIAQHELERVYQESKSTSVNALVNNSSYCSSFITGTLPDYSCTLNLTNHPYIVDTAKYSIKIDFTKSTEAAIENSNFYNVVVSVNENHKLKAKMESLYKFKN